MDRHRTHDAAPDSAAAANSVRSDFIELIALFDRRLASLPDAEDHERSHLTKAKAVAERGLKLSQELIERLREPI
jgi:hypothetical protein